MGNQEQFLNAWVADPGGTVNIQGPLFLEGGIYHLKVEIFGVDSIRNIFADEDIPKFDSWLSVGDVFTQNVDYRGQPYNTTVISYYDRYVTLASIVAMRRSDGLCHLIGTSHESKTQTSLYMRK